MFTNKAIFPGIVALLVGAGAFVASGQRPKLPGEDWITLFNGKDLSGWVEIGNEKWTVEGRHHPRAPGSAKPMGICRPTRSTRTFTCRSASSAKATATVASFFHTDFKPGTPDVSQGLQFEIDCVMNHHTGGVYGDGRQWIVWPAPENEGVVRQTDWNDYQMRVEGNRYVSRLNGVQMIDFTDPTPKSFDGYIALQLHSGGHGNMRFKDIHIRDLTKR
jgi:hypothetical protein